MIRRAAGRLPQPARDALRRALRRYRSLRYRAGAKLRPVRLSVDDLERAPREAGVVDGDTVFVQAAMSAFGTFDDGAHTVIEALERAVGPDTLGSYVGRPPVADRGPLDLNPTDRPYHLGWILEAWCGREHLAREGGAPA